MNKGTRLALHGPQMGPEMDPVTLILGDLDQIKALHGPFKDNGKTYIYSLV